MLLRLPFSFTQHLDAGPVHQQMQARGGHYGANGHLQRLLQSAYRAVVRYRPAEPSQAQQALRHAHGLTQRQTERGT